MYNFTASGTSVSGVNDPQVGQGTYSSGAWYSYDPTNSRLFVYNQTNHDVTSGTHSTLLTTANNTDNTGLAGGTNNDIRGVTFDADSGLSMSIRGANPSVVHYYAPQVDNFYYFVGCAKEAASANTTVKIANSGQIATGLSGLTAGTTYRIRYNGTWSNYSDAIGYPTAFVNASQRAQINGVALTTSTMLLVNDFQSYN